ncbi:Uncharacterised protein [Mycobacteroides abscessus subsp. abscessus]|nr:Uncharacterised protein [Mycobacteroides abscessus subsp. abscessus]
MTNNSAKSGFCERSSENSSTTMNNAGNGSKSAPLARARSYSVTLGKFPDARSSSWRRFISPASASRIRSTRMSSSSRLVMMAETWGTPSRPRNVAPPLKSTSTRFRASGECEVIIERTSVRRNSDLPDPVAPMQSPCGPIPFSAASLISSSSGWPFGVMPMGTRSRSRGVRGRQTCSGTISAASGIFSSAMRPGSLARDSDSKETIWAALAGRNRPMRRAVACASATDSESGEAKRSTPTAVRAPTSPDSTTNCSPRLDGGRRSEPALRSSTVTLSNPASVTRRSSPET